MNILLIEKKRIFRPTTDVEIFTWMKSQFHNHYDGNRAPFGFYTHVAWFIGNEVRFQAFLMFVEYLNSLPDVFLVKKIKQYFLLYNIYELINKRFEYAGFWIASY